MMATSTKAQELSQDVKPPGAVQRDEALIALPDAYPDLPAFLERRAVDEELKKQTDEWNRSRIRTMLLNGPLVARKRFVWEVLLSEIIKAG
jgi:hypothetical protein